MWHLLFDPSPPTYTIVEQSMIESYEDRGKPVRAGLTNGIMDTLAIMLHHAKTNGLNDYTLHVHKPQR